MVESIYLDLGVRLVRYESFPPVTREAERGEIEAVRAPSVSSHMAQSAVPPRPLRRSELPFDTVELARYLVGATLVREHPAGRMSGRIVETEAYLVGDAACHAFRGETPRNRSLFLERGHAYVYFTYGTHFMMNVSAGRPGIGTGVLLRAIEPLEGIDLMQARRGITKITDLARGPGRLAAAMEIDKKLDGVDLCAAGPLFLAVPIRPAGDVGVSTRIGITREVERKLRFYERRSAYVSGPRRLRE